MGNGDGDNGNGRSISDRLVADKVATLKSAILSDDYSQCTLKSRKELDLFTVEVLGMWLERDGKTRGYHIPRNPREFAYALLLRSPTAFVLLAVAIMWFHSGTFPWRDAPDNNGNPVVSANHEGRGQ